MSDQFPTYQAQMEYVCLGCESCVEVCEHDAINVEEN